MKSVSSNYIKPKKMDDFTTVKTWRNGIIRIPNKWQRKLNIKHGQYITLILEGDKIIISRTNALQTFMLELKNQCNLANQEIEIANTQVIQADNELRKILKKALQ